MTKSEYADYEATVAAFFEREGIQNLSTGHLQCPDCEIDFECSACPRCGKDAGSFPLEPFFSWSACDCCGTTLGSNREDAHGWNPATREIQTYTVCEDCVYYAEYGQLDDRTMMEIEQEK
jgi:hypothetical protein